MRLRMTSGELARGQACVHVMHACVLCASSLTMVFKSKKYLIHVEYAKNITPATR
jgi:hypothetical protein